MLTLSHTFADDVSIDTRRSAAGSGVVVQQGYSTPTGPPNAGPDAAPIPFPNGNGTTTPTPGVPNGTTTTTPPPPTTLVVPPVPPPVGSEVAFYKRPWFWGLMLGIVVVGGGAYAVGKRG